METHAGHQQHSAVEDQTSTLTTNSKLTSWPSSQPVAKRNTRAVDWLFSWGSYRLLSRSRSHLAHSHTVRPPFLLSIAAICHLKPTRWCSSCFFSSVSGSRIDSLCLTKLFYRFMLLARIVEVLQQVRILYHTFQATFLQKIQSQI